VADTRLKTAKRISPNTKCHSERSEESLFSASQTLRFAQGDGFAMISTWYFVVLCGAGVLYVISCAPGPLWQDSGLIQYRVWHNDIEGFFGLALAHPLFYMVAIGAKHLPLGEFAHKVNLVSAVAAAVAVANLFLLVRLWLGKNLPALIAAITLAISHTFWRHASIAETYTLWAALFLAELVVLLQYAKTNRVGYLYWLGLLNGLAIAVHMLACIPLLCYAVFLIALLAKREIRYKDLAIISILWIVGALPYEYLIIKNMIQTGDVTGTFASVLFGLRWQGAVLNTSVSASITKENLQFILYNFPTPNILLLFMGCFALFKISGGASFRNILLGLIVLFFIFAFRYTIEDRYAFFIPFYCMAAIFIGIGAHLLQQWLKRPAFAYLLLVFSLLPVCAYAIAPTMAEKSQFNIGTRNDIPCRNDYKYFLQPWKTGYNGTERFADEALGVVGTNAVILADGTTVGPLLHAQEVEGKRPDVNIVSAIVSSKRAPDVNESTIGQLLEDRSVYVVSKQAGYCPAFVLENYDLTRSGLLWRVVPREKK
jgi:hypothetical protein